MTARESDVNVFLQGNFAPWRLEGTADDLEVIGAIPRELNGTFYRNGPNPAYEPCGRYHWFDGDGMIHAITLRDGRAAYRNRWVQSDGLKEERAAGEALYPGLLDISPSEAPKFRSRPIPTSCSMGDGCWRSSKPRYPPKCGRARSRPSGSTTSAANCSGR
jgi:carotenoid cleavage dioxygenase